MRFCGYTARSDKNKGIWTLRFSTLFARHFDVESADENMVKGGRGLFAQTSMTRNEKSNEKEQSIFEDDKKVGGAKKRRHLCRI